MNRRQLTLAGLLVSVAVFLAGEVNAQARGQLTPGPQRSTEPAGGYAAREAKLAELDAWLRRLVGKFRYEGEIQISAFACDNRGPCEIPGFNCVFSMCFAVRTFQGAGDCMSIGAGPGVHCVINVPWPESIQVPHPFTAQLLNLRWRGRLLAPAMIQYGMDTDSLGIRYLLVDSKSIAESALGVLRGDTVTFTTAGCVNSGLISCRQIFSIHASRDGKVIQMSLDLEYIPSRGSGYRKFAGTAFTLYREPQID